MEDQGDVSNADHRITAAGVVLSPTEVTLLGRWTSADSRPPWLHCANSAVSSKCVLPCFLQFSCPLLT
jgi:hypothetical protein